jgi:hypothetical protein
MLRIVTLLACLTWLAFQASPSLAQEPTDCDKLTAEEALPAEADANAAVTACEAALAAQPGEPRIVYQYALALERDGRIEDAIRMYRWAADDGYGPAVEAVARLSLQVTGPLPDAATDKIARASETLASLALALRRYTNTLPPDPSDPLPILAEIGTEPESILAWVTHNTRLVGYRGSLRGAKGVLLDRSGNSLDRALLLATLLHNAGHEVRLARATLNENQARALLTVADDAVTVPVLPPGAEDAMVAMMTEAGVDPALVSEAVAQTAKQKQRSEELREKRFAAVFPALREAVAGHEADGSAAAQAEIVTALQDHFWVQLRTGTAWRDVDPEGDSVGQLTPEETLDVIAAPEALRHSVVLRLVLELQNETGRREETILEWSGYPADIIDRPIVLFHLAPSVGSLDELLGTSDYERRMLDALDRDSKWTPILKVGTDAIVDKLFTSDGSVTVADLNALQTVGRSIGGMADAIVDVFGSDETAAPAEVAIPTAEWIEVEVRVPGADPITERRTIFDILGPAARAAGAPGVLSPQKLRERAIALLGWSEVLIVGATPSPIQVTRIAARDLATIAENASTVLAETAAVLKSPPSSPELPLALYAFASERLGSEATMRPTLARPNVFLRHHRLVFDGALSVEEQIEFDIVHHEVYVPQAGFSARLAQGVADTVLEGMLHLEASSVRNAAVIHFEDLLGGRQWKTIAPSDLPRLAGAASDGLTRLERDLKSGYLVIAPANLAEAVAEERLAWWRIDPRTGTALGMLPSGGGASMSGYGKLLQLGFYAACAYKAIGAGISQSAARAAGVALCLLSTGLPGNIAYVIGGVGAALSVYNAADGYSPSIPSLPRPGAQRGPR